MCEVIAKQVTPVCVNHGEGPVWDEAEGVLCWVDMLAGDVMTLNPDARVERRHLAPVVAALRPRQGGGMVLAVERGFMLVDPDGQVSPVYEAFGDPEVRMNDGGCDRSGRFFCGSMAYSMAPGRGGLYRFDTDHQVTQVLSGLTISNGMAWSLDGSALFYVDTGTGRIDVFDYDTEAGLMYDRRPVVEIGPDLGMPDGLAMDEEGGLWVALWQGGAVHRYDRRGRLTAVVEVPASQVTSCAFGGARGDELYITTSREGLSEGAEPSAGALFMVDPGIRGAPVATFAG